tara:strand:+ start:323 stop:772 length:450 start_codon:yes stop_codon:yes gene_type:complete
MRFILAALILTITSVLTMTAMANPLAEYRWSYRPVLVFAPSQQDQNFTDQMRAIRQQIGSAYERDIMHISVAGETVDLDAADLSDTAPQLSFDATDLRRKYGVNDDQFVVVLVGKDGGEKGRWDEPVNMGEIFSLIDTMPMRQREMGNY